MLHTMYVFRAFCLVYLTLDLISFNHVTADDLVVLITGCSSGIGKSIAKHFADSSTVKFKVFATMRDPSAWTDGPRINIRVLTMDVTSEDSVAHAVKIIEEEAGRVDVVINNAGYGIAGALESVRISEAKALFDVNVWGAVRVLQAVLPLMRKSRKGHVINISSTSGIRGIPCFEFYTGSKFALEGIADSLRYSLAPYGISVTNINAGPVRTNFTDRFGNVERGGRGSRPYDNPEYLNSLTNLMIDSLDRRMASSEAQTSEEVAQLVLNVVKLKLEAARIKDVPFNIGSARDSQAVLDAVRLNPTGWGGIYNRLLENVPSLPSDPSHEEL